MGNFLKNFGLGLIFMICSPLLACLVVIGAGIGIIYFLFASLRIIFRFFRGLKPIAELEIDVRVEQIKRRLDLSLATPSSPQSKPESQPIYVTQNYYQAPPQVPPAQAPSPQPLPTTQVPVSQPLPPTQEATSSQPLGPDIFEIPQETAEITFEDEEENDE